MAIWMLVVFVVTLVLGLPIFMSIAAAMLVPILFETGFPANAEFLFRAVEGGVNTTVMLAMPLFILSGNIMGRGGISKRLFDVFALVSGKAKAGVPIAVVLTSVVYAAICGSGPAATAAVGAMAIPVMRAQGYKDEFSATLSASGGGIGIIIPPSLPFITYALLAGTSVGDMFTAGIIPGLLIAVCLIGYIILYCSKADIDAERVAENYRQLRARGVWKVLKDGFFALLAPVIILGGIYSGIVTPTEAAVISVFYSIIICLFVYRSLSFKDIVKILEESVKGYAGIGIMIGFAMALSKILTLENVSTMLANFVVNNFANSALLLGAVVILLLFAGMFMDTLPLIILITPILVPVLNVMNINLVQFGIIATTTIAIGMISPPYGLNLFVAAGIANIAPGRTFKIAIGFCIAYLVAIILVTYIPALTLCLL